MPPSTLPSPAARVGPPHRPDGPAIALAGISKRYGHVVAVDDLTLTVERSTVYGLLGPNGAGKTTTLRLLAGLIRGDVGSISVDGFEVSPGRGLPPGVGALVDRPSCYPYLTAAENLRVFALAAGMAPRSIDNAVASCLGRVDLADAAIRRVGGFSTGMRQRLGIALAILGRPSVLLLDEPVNGLDPQGIADVRGLIRELRQEGTTILLSSHLLAEIELVCSHVGILDHGRLLMTGPLSEARSEVDVRLTFKSERDSSAAAVALREAGFSIAPKDGEDAAVTVIGRAGEDAVATLAAVGLYPSEVRRTGSSLEARFLALTRRSGSNRALEEDGQ